MLEKVCDKNILTEYARVLASRGFKPGFDNMTAEALMIWLEINGDVLVRDLLHGRYKPMPAIGFHVAKKHGGHRSISRLTALDTVIQQALLDAVREEAERQFSPRSHAYRKGRGVSTAVAQYCAEGMAHPFASKLDPAACFDNIDHDVLRSAVADFFGEEALTRLIMRCAESRTQRQADIPAQQRTAARSDNHVFCTRCKKIRRQISDIYRPDIEI